MFSSNRLRFASLIGACAIAVTALASVAFERVKLAGAMAADWLRSVPAAFADHVQTWRSTHGPSVALTRARQYHLRQVERETPVVRPLFRACPSI